MLRFDKVEPVGIHPICLGMYHHFEILLKRLTDCSNQQSFKYNHALIATHTGFAFSRKFPPPRTSHFNILQINIHWSEYKKANKE